MPAVRNDRFDPHRLHPVFAHPCCTKVAQTVVRHLDAQFRARSSTLYSAGYSPRRLSLLCSLAPSSLAYFPKTGCAATRVSCAIHMAARLRGSRSGTQSVETQKVPGCPLYCQGRKQPTSLLSLGSPPSLRDCLRRSVTHSFIMVESEYNCM